MREARLVAVLTTPPTEQAVLDLPPTVRCLEVRADLAGDIDPDWLRSRFLGELLYTLRSRAEGGEFAGGREERQARLLAAARRWDLVDLEAGDLETDVLAHLPPARRVLSWHGLRERREGLRARWARFRDVPCRLARLVPWASEATDALAPLQLLHEAGRPSLTAFADGPAGLWSRVLAPRLGAPWAFAAGWEGADAACLAADYGLPALPPLEALFGLVGPRAIHSLSPRLHNAAYAGLQLPALYLPFPTRDFAAFWRLMGEGLRALGFSLAGLTVSGPHKEAALAAAEEASPFARQVGAANTLVRRGSGWQAETVDAEGVLSVLGARGVRLAGQRAAVVGCGGAGRAVAAGLRAAGAYVTLVNRGMERGRLASRLLGLPFVPLGQFDPRPFSLLVHATPVTDRLPFTVSGLPSATAVVELVYGAEPTALMAASRRGGVVVVIDGREVLSVESARQFELMTGRPMPAASEPAPVAAPSLPRARPERRAEIGLAGVRDEDA